MVSEEGISVQIVLPGTIPGTIPAQNLTGATHVLSYQSWCLSVSTGEARFGNQSKETKTSDKLVLTISGNQGIFRTGSHESPVLTQLTLRIFQCPILSLEHGLVVGSQDLSPIHGGVLKSFLRLFSRITSPKKSKRGFVTQRNQLFSAAKTWRASHLLIFLKTLCLSQCLHNRKEWRCDT